MNKPPPSYYLCLAIIATSLLTILYASLKQAVWIPTFHMDGAYQTASGLFRLQSGQMPGRDFFPYLGIGPVFAVFPAFLAFGGDLAAAIMAAKFTTMSLGWFAASVIWKLFFSAQGKIQCLVGGVVALTLVMTLDKSIAWFYDAAFLMEPGNSLRPIRSIAPYCMVVLMFVLCRSMLRPILRDCLAGLCIGVLILWSNDFAIPTVFTFGSFYALFILLRPGQANRLISLSRFATVVILSAALILTLATAGYPLKILAFNFRDVAPDQWWYFGTYREVSRIFEPGDILKLFSIYHWERFGLSLGVLACVFVLAMATKKFEHLLLLGLGTAMFLGGLLPSVGGFLSNYFKAFNSWAALTFMVALLKGVIWAFKHLQKRQPAVSLPTQTATLVLLSMFLLTEAYKEFSEYRDLLTEARTTPGAFRDPVLGGYLTKDWKTYVNYARAHSDQIAIEEYWSIWSALNGQFADWPVDAAIHALGRVRQNAVSALDKADVIITTHYNLSPGWQPWSVSQNYWLYQILFRNWYVALESPLTVVWRRLPQPRAFEPTSCVISPDGRSFTLPEADVGLYHLQLNYDVSGTGRRLAFIENNISYGPGSYGYVSVPPDGGAVSLPVRIPLDGRGRALQTRTLGGLDVAITLTTCDAARIPFADESVIRHDFALGPWQRAR
ncbi:hypothetical protein ROLI_046090 (plasmid) [Roseobacter fucihabitans]|uniref:Transmembrane protein n=1 Tax=Roseobacter fucihabitans TaxID=1537242 RepID=A0ABZ2C2I0_9RHOB|nr:hypothetical protein [Roseobacter litoralis]MBC6966897.1 hypothetical protein [Roseobacter litoralis]